MDDDVPLDGLREDPIVQNIIMDDDVPLDGLRRNGTLRRSP
jgi:hypothetical protein